MFFNSKKNLVFLAIAVVQCMFAQTELEVILDGTSQRFSTEISAKNHLDSLVELGFYALKIDSIQTEKSNTKWFAHKGKSYKKLTVSLDSLSQIVLSQKSIETHDIDSILQSIHHYYLEKGFPFNKVVFGRTSNQFSIRTALGKSTFVQKIIVESDSKITKQFTKDLEREFVGKSIHPQALQSISQYTKPYRFLTETRKPQVLFTQDSTMLYVYVKKKKSSYVDGIVGFASDKEGDLKLSGNVQLQLQNVFGAFEKIGLQWNSSVDKAQDLHIAVETPYFITNRLGSSFDVTIFRQDSTFAVFTFKNTLYYKLKYNHKLGLNGFLQSSNYLSESESGKDFSKNGLGIFYEKYEPLSTLFAGNEYYFSLQLHSITQKISGEKSLSQYQISSTVEKTFTLHSFHYLQLKAQYYNLLSESYTQNELQRIGGVYSLRGFNEQSIYTNQYLLSSVEYKFMPSDYFYANAFVDYAHTQNSVNQLNQNLIGAGIGIGFLSKFGFFTLQYALGKFPNSSFDFGQSKIHIGIKAVF